MKKLILLFLTLLLGVTASWAETSTWESKEGWTQASGGMGSYTWFGVHTPGDASTKYSLTAIQLMQQTGSGNNDNYLAIARVSATSTLDANHVVAISDNHLAASQSTGSLEAYNFSAGVELLGGTTYYLVFLSSNTPTDGAYPVRAGRLSLNHTDYGTYTYGNSYSMTSTHWLYYKATVESSSATGFCTGDILGGSMDSGNWKNLWTSGTTPSFTITCNANNINNSASKPAGGLDIRSGTAKSATYTITAPSGYVITGYKLFGKALTTNQIVTPSEGGSAVTFTTNGNSLCVTGIETQQTSFTLTDTDNSGLFLHALQVNLEVLAYSVTYIVKDGSGNTLFTSDPVGTTNGANITTLPAEYQFTGFYTYNNIDLTISSSGNTDAVFTATPKAEPLVKYTADTSSPYYYNLSIRSKYMVYDSENSDKGYISLVDTSEPFNPNAAWAFIGEPYAGFKLINQAKGTSYDLTYTSVVTGNNSGNNNIQFVDDAEFNNRYWFVESNNGGICMRMKENTNIYFHHQSGADYNFLRTCSVGEWSAVHNDAGSTIVASTDEEVLYALYNSMKDYTFGTAIGQFNTTNAEVVTNDQATSTISSVGAAIASSMTSAYADCYSALNTLAANIAMVTPSAGFYRLRNVATDKYLVATALASNYADTNKYVFANGNASDAATVIMLTNEKPNQDAADGIYMYNQGYGFGWTATNTGGGVAWVTSSPDKYVNWFPGTAAGRIAFAICLGNGTGDYASYLKKGIYTANGDKEVVAGTDETLDAAQWLVEAATEATVSLHSDGAGTYYATFCAPFSYTVSEGTKAYTLDESGNWLVPTEVVGAVPAGTPVLLKGTEPSATLTIYGTDYVATPSTDTDLTGTYLAKTIDGDNDYVLGIDKGVVGFYHWNSNNLGANRAYVDTPEQSEPGVKGYVISWDDETGIKNLNVNDNLNKVVYDLSGRRIQKPTKGLYIVNGKKVMVK